MTFEVTSVDDRKVEDVGFTVQFQQMAPVSVSFVNATGSVVEAAISTDVSDDTSEEPLATLDDELAELKSMMRQLAALEYAISSKVQYLADVYDFKRPDEFHSFAECDSLKCIVKTMYSRAKDMASRLYEGPFGRYGHGHGFPGGRHHRHHPAPRPFPHGDHEGHPPFPHGDHEGHPPFPHGDREGHPPFPPHHGHGNSSHPPHHPHHPPPPCHCGPPPFHPPPPGPPHRHGPPGHPPPPGPPGHPPFDHPPFDHPPPPPPPPGHHFPGHHGPPGPPEPVGEFDNDKEPSVDFEGDKPGRPFPIVEDEGDFPDFPMTPEDRSHQPPPHHPRPHQGLPSHRKPHNEAHHREDRPPFHNPKSHGRPFHGPPPPPPPFGPPGLFYTKSILHIGAIVVLLGLLISAIHTRCFGASRQGRRSGCCGRHQAREGRCQHRGGSWASRRTAITAKYSEVVGWLKEGVRRQEIEDEEKEAIMKRIGSDSDEEDNLSTTMEQEIAQFRTAANVVGSLVAAEEGQSREYAQEMRQASPPTPPSPTSAFPDYASVEEELPAYDEGSDDSRFVADGFRYTPGSSCYGSSESSTTESSLDEHLGRKQ
ncbi:hypothetical protein GGR53DRAFT_28387 [Hypoxylon sp. FL1150]|nr:hypothetical protein GGR53DRAFT_28387 [Hypoxylon sp. FL1150]